MAAACFRPGPHAFPREAVMFPAPVGAARFRGLP